MELAFSNILISGDWYQLYTPPQIKAAEPPRQEGGLISKVLFDFLFNAINSRYAP